MLLVTVSLIGLVIGVTTAALFAYWLDNRLKWRPLQPPLEIARESEGIIAVAPLDPRRGSLIALHKEPEPEHIESIEPEGP